MIDKVYGKTGDDMVALNADDYGVYAFENGPITNGTVKNVHGSGSYRGVRLLSAKSLIDQIEINGITGTFSKSALLYSYPKGSDLRGNFGNIQIKSINASELIPDEPVVDISAPVGRIVIDAITRTQEQQVPGDHYAATIMVRKGNTVRSLHIGALTESDNTAEGYTGIDVAGTIDNLSVNKWTRTNTQNTDRHPLVQIEESGSIGKADLPDIRK